MRFVFDTNTCIYALKLQGRVVERMQEHQPSEIAHSGESGQSFRSNPDSNRSEATLW